MYIIVAFSLGVDTLIVAQTVLSASRSGASTTMIDLLLLQPVSRACAVAQGPSNSYKCHFYRKREETLSWLSNLRPNAVQSACFT